MSATSPTSSNDDSEAPLSQLDVKPKPKPNPTPRQASFSSQELFMLAQACMRESLDPIRRTNEKADTMWKDIHDAYNYNKLRQAQDQARMERLSLDTPFIPFSKCTSILLKNDTSFTTKSFIS